MTTPLIILLEKYRELEIGSLAAMDPADQLRHTLENNDTLADAIFDQIINPADYDSQRLLGNEVAQGLSAAAEHLSAGLAWAGFWVGAGVVIVAAIVKWGA